MCCPSRHHGQDAGLERDVFASHLVRALAAEDINQFVRIGVHVLSERIAQLQEIRGCTRRASDR